MTVYLISWFKISKIKDVIQSLNSGGVVKRSIVSSGLVLVERIRDDEKGKAIKGPIDSGRD